MRAGSSLPAQWPSFPPRLRGAPPHAAVRRSLSLQPKSGRDADGARAEREIVFLRGWRSGRGEWVRLRQRIVHHRVGVEQVVAESRDLPPAAKLNAGARGGEAGGGQRVGKTVIVLAGVVRILDWREPGVAAGVLPVEAHERVVLKGLEGVLRAEGERPRRARARCVVDRRVARNCFALEGEPADRILAEAGVGIARREFKGKPAAE